MAKFKLSLGAKPNEAGKHEILVRITIDRVKRIRVRSGVYVSPMFFDGEKNEIKPPRSGINKDTAEREKNDLDNYISKLGKIVSELQDDEEISADKISRSIKAVKDVPVNQITKREIDRGLEQLTIEEQRKERGSFFALSERFLEENKLAETRKKTYRVLFRGLARYEAFIRQTEKKKKNFRLDVDELTPDDMKNIFKFFAHEKELSEKYPKIFAELLANYPVEIQKKHKSPVLVVRGESTINKYKKLMRRFFNWLNEGENPLTTNNPMRGVKIDSDKYGTPYYLSLAERNKIADWDFSDDKRLEEQRDIFVFQCLTGCRVGDLLRLKNNNIVNGNLQYIPHKTIGKQPKEVKVPLNKRALAILAKYEHKNSTEQLFPFIAAQNYNEYIKKILTICGVTRNVTIRNPKTGEDEQRPINELASSHMARRCFVGLLYEQVPDPAIIGSMSGHSEGSRAFSRYRTITQSVKQKATDLIE